jgi:hypothetical protein
VLRVAHNLSEEGASSDKPEAFKGRDLQYGKKQMRNRSVGNGRSLVRNPESSLKGGKTKCRILGIDVEFWQQETAENQLETKAQRKGIGQQWLIPFSV